MTYTNEQREADINRILDYTDGFIRDQGKDIKTIDRMELNNIMYEFSNEAGIPELHHRQAFAHQIALLNSIHSNFLRPNINQNQKHKNMKKVKPILPLDLQILDKQDDRDEPTHRRTVQPYISPMLERFMKGGEK